MIQKTQALTRIIYLRFYKNLKGCYEWWVWHHISREHSRLVNRWQTSGLLCKNHFWQSCLFPLNVKLVFISSCTFYRAWILSVNVHRFSLSKSANKGEIMFICLVKLPSTVFRFSFNLWISNCLSFSIFFGVHVSFFSNYRTGQWRYCTWWPTARWFVFQIHFTPGGILSFIERIFLWKSPSLPPLCPSMCDSLYVKLYQP